MRVEEIRRLIKLVEESQIDELEVRRLWTRVRILKQSENHSEEKGKAIVVSPPLPVAPTPPPAREPAPAPPAAPAPESAPPPAAAPAEEEGLVPVKSPMVGTFYRAPSPQSPPYVEVNQRVEVGQVVCIVEAMKLMNEIESEIAGTIVRILVQNAQPVEFNQDIFLVRPD
jgi:acetyl-CoA carboxylase biotin carboxyl carrier protein